MVENYNKKSCWSDGPQKKFKEKLKILKKTIVICRKLYYNLGVWDNHTLYNPLLIIYSLHRSSRHFPVCCFTFYAHARKGKVVAAATCERRGKQKRKSIFLLDCNARPQRESSCCPKIIAKLFFIFMNNLPPPRNNNIVSWTSRTTKLQFGRQFYKTFQRLGDWTVIRSDARRTAQEWRKYHGNRE